MKCNQISAIKDKPTRHSIETYSFRFVQYFKKETKPDCYKRRRAGIESFTKARDIILKTRVMLIESYFACQFGAFHLRKFVFPITQSGIDQSLLSFADLSFCHIHSLYSAGLHTSTLPMAELIEQERMFPRCIVPSNRHH